MPETESIFEVHEAITNVVSRLDQEGQRMSCPPAGAFRSLN
jgi:hypothetical protein